MDPYQVLGVKLDATQEEIHAAYIALVKKYHPDRYLDSPLKDQAAEKLKEINAAYEILTGKRTQTGPGAGPSYRAASAELARARAYIAADNLREARAVLDGLSEHGAEWHYLYGVIYRRQGWLDQARQYFATAARMAPNNAEYAEAGANLENASRPFSYAGASGPSGGAEAGGCSACDLCTGLLCADCCCECMGGDLIRCC